MVMRKAVLVFGLAASMLVITHGVGEVAQENTTGSMPGDMPASAWRQLAKQRIFFAHQSVGYNIIDGIRDIMKPGQENTLRIVEGSAPSLFDRSILAHTRLGRNGDPISKIRAWETYMAEGVGGRADLAMFKFCYVDITPATDIPQLFGAYRDLMEKVKLQYPKTTFIHVTMPLTTVQTGVKASVKRMLGRPLDGSRENAKRNEFNELLRGHYGGREPVFDLARIEYSLPDGRTSTYEFEGRQVYSLAPAYTDDGGHLNEMGRRRAAENLLKLLARLSQPEHAR